MWKRRFFQLVSLAFNNSYFLSFLKFCPTPVLNCYACPWSIAACPIGTLQHFAVIGRIPYLLTGFFLLIGGFVGRMVCGWVCPIGWLQEMLYKIPVKKWQIRWKPLKYLKYAVLIILVLWLPYVTKDPWFSKLCFVGTLEAGIPLVLTDSEIRELITSFFFLKLVITTGFLVLFVFVKRPFCRFFCPLGAIYSLFNKMSFVQLKVDNRCTKCGACQKICPVDIKIYENPNSPECIRCLECTTICKSVRVSKNTKKEPKEVTEILCVKSE